MAYYYNTRARARSDVEPDDISQGDLDVEMTTATVSDTTIVGRQVEFMEGLELMSTEVAGPVTTHSQLLPEGDHSSVGGHGSLGSVSSSLMGVTLGYPSEHTDPRDSTTASTDEGQSIAGSTAIATPGATAGSRQPTTTRQPPTDIETAAATSPTLDSLIRFVQLTHHHRAWINLSYSPVGASVHPQLIHVRVLGSLRIHTQPA